MTQMYKLPNGMEVLFEENHTAPVISFHALVKVGSAMETKREGGISHLIEHMLFKGTPTRKVGAIAKEIEAAGGEINAFTSFDQTVYFINMASRFADKGLQILADAIQHPVFDKIEFEREKEVIIEEIRREKDNPSHNCAEILFTKAYKRHPYGNPIIGNAKTVKAFTREHIINFYKHWYTPNNIVLIVVGAFDTGRMLKNIRKVFGGFRGMKVKHIRLPAEPTSKKMTVHVEENPVKASYFSLGFHIPGMTHADTPALDVLSHVIAETDSSRLEQIVKEKKQLVNEVYSYPFTPREPGLFIIGGLTSPGKTNKALRSIWNEIHKLHLEPIKNSELNRAKLNIRSSEIYEKETTSGQASKYAYFLATTGNHLFEKQYYRALQEVRAEDVRRVAQKYLVPENTTFTVIRPKGSGKLINTAGIKNQIKGKKPATQLAKKAAKCGSSPSVHRLSNGIKLVIQENHILPIVSCSAVMYGGLRLENKKTNGINNLLARTIIKGTKNRTAIEIANKIESIAGVISGFSGRNSFGLKSEFLSDYFGDGFDLFTEVLTQPSFTASEVSKEKLQVLDAIKNQEDALTSLAFSKFLAALFPHHPYGLKPLGEKRSVRGFTSKHLFDYYKRIADPKNMTISIVGDVSTEDVVKLAEDKLVFPTRVGKRFCPPKHEAQNKKAITVEYQRPGKEQAHIVMGFLGPVIGSKDRYAIAVLNDMLSGQGGRLFLTLRDRMGLAYAVSSTFFAGLEPGFMAIYIGTEPSKVATAIAGIKKELAGLLKYGFSTSELVRSKNHIIGSFEMEKQRTAALADSYAFNTLYNLGIKEVEEFSNKINSTKKTDVLNCARRYLRLDAPVVAIVKPQ